MIGGQRQHDGLGVAGLGEGGASRNGRAGITPHRLQQYVGLEADIVKLLAHHEAIGGAGDDDWPIEQRRIRHPQQRILKGRARPEQRQKLFRAALARRWPQPRPAPPHMINGMMRLFI